MQPITYLLSRLWSIVPIIQRIHQTHLTVIVSSPFFTILDNERRAKVPENYGLIRANLLSRLKFLIWASRFRAREWVRWGSL